MNIFEIIFGNVVQILYLLVILYQVTKIRISLLETVIVISISLIFGFILEYAFFIPLGILLFFICLYHQKEPRKLISWFYSVYAIFVGAVLLYLFTIGFYHLLGAEITNKYIFPLNLFLYPLLGILIHGIFIRLIRPNIEFFSESIDTFSQPFLWFINLGLTACCILQFGNYWLEKYFFKGDNPVRGYVLLLFVCLIFMLLKYINMKSAEFKATTIYRLKETQLEQLTGYVEKIEGLYKELRGFRHDYQNTLFSLEASMETNDLEVIRKTYDDILKKEGMLLSKNSSNLEVLSNIHILPVKSILSALIIKALQQNVEVNIEIENTIESVPIDLLDFVRILSVLLDNAIEGALTSETPAFTFAYILDEIEKEQIIIVENTFEGQLDGRKLEVYGYSTKGTHRGIGLFNVASILKQYDHIELMTEIQEHTFRQTLIIKETS